MSLLNQLPTASFNALARKVKAAKPSPFVLQVGAMDGIMFDPMHPLLVEGGWRGLLIEPLPDMFRALQKTYAAFPDLQLLNCAIADHDGILKLYRLDPAAIAINGLPPEALGVTTARTDRGFLTRKDYMERLAAHTRTVEVPCCTLPHVLAVQNIAELDVIVIDTEGYDWLIVRQLDLKRYNPPLVCLEYSNLNGDEMQACCMHFITHGYNLGVCREDSENMLFYKE
jgi:FkbM family methyltransferase